MTKPTPEERADKLLEFYHETGGLHNMTIAQAIREAEAAARNEALEKVATDIEGPVYKEVYRGTVNYNWHPDEHEGRLRKRLAENVRARKTTEKT